MKSHSKIKTLHMTLAVALAMIITSPVLAAQPPFEATFDITPSDGEVTVGNTLTLTAEWTTNRDVTRYEWSVEGASQGEMEVGGSSLGEQMFDFDPEELGLVAGNYQVCFRIRHHQQHDRDATGCVNVTVTDEDECDQWESETAWADGFRYNEHGNWATYTQYDAEPKVVTLFAGQTMEAGTVWFSSSLEHEGKVTITIDLNSGWRFSDVLENVKIQGYESEPPAGNPSPGQFTDKGNAEPTESTFSIEVDHYSYYGVHVDLEWANCDLQIPVN